MSLIMDKIKTNISLGAAFKRIRQEKNLRPTDLSIASGRSRDILYRLEAGKDVSVSALLDILRASGYAIQLVPAGMPTLEEVRAAFANDDEDDDATS